MPAQLPCPPVASETPTVAPQLQSSSHILLQNPRFVIALIGPPQTIRTGVVMPQDSPMLSLAYVRQLWRSASAIVRASDTVALLKCQREYAQSILRSSVTQTAIEHHVLGTHRWQRQEPADVNSALRRGAAR